MPTFTPLPEDTEIVDSFEHVPLDEQDPNDDGDDTVISQWEVPNLLGRLRDRVRRP